MAGGTEGREIRTMRGIAWYINRLSKMSGPEVFYRVQHKLRERSDKILWRTPLPSLNSTGMMSLDKILAMSPDFTGQEVLDTLVRSKTDAFCEDRLDIFGIEHHFSEGIDWHLDVKTGKRWPRYFWSDINIRDGFTIGGPKFVWEQNRLYQVPTLGLAYHQTNDQKYGDKLLSLVAGWMQGNPYPFGVNWTSGIELGTRLANLIWGLSFLDGYRFKAEQEKTLNEFFWFHGRHLYHYPSKYSSNNNHAIAEAFGLFLIGTFCPYFAEASKWQAFGKKVLEQEGLRQILADGGSYEYSTTYLSFVFDFFLLFKIICDRQSIEYNPNLNRRLEASCEYIHTLIDDQGNITNIGDQDSAVLVNFGLDNHENFKSILNTGAVLFDRPEFMQHNFPDIKTLCLLGEQKVSSWESAVCCNDTKTGKETKNRGLPATHLFEKSGLSVVRASMNSRDMLFVGNATPLGMPPLYAHGHLDPLSFYLSLDGREIFVDPGTYLYHSGGKWRRYFRSTAAHNTIRISGQELTEMPGDFMFGKPYNITEHSLNEKDGVIVWRAGHDAYIRQTEPVMVEREAAVYCNQSKIILQDTVKPVPGSSCLAELFFHLHPNCSAKLSNNALRITNGNIDVTMHFDKEMALTLYRGNEEPLAGWFSSAFNRIETCFTLRGSLKLSEPRKIGTEIVIGVP